MMEKESKTTEKTIKFTPAQQTCIDERGKDILVSAAAGSGKTAVLVERIIQLILDTENPVDIDELLVVTFTKAAAAQMKEKVAKAVTKRLEMDPGNEHLERQAALVHNAQITTIDSFCTFVIRNNFGDIGLDPGFRVGDEGEMKLLRQDVLENVLEECYEEGDASFLELAECFSSGASDAKLEEAVLDLFDVSMSYPFPDKWLANRLLDYDTERPFDETDWYGVACSQMEVLCEASLAALKQAQKVCETSGGPYMYGEMIDSDIEQIEHFSAKLRESAPYESLQGFAQGIQFAVLSRKKDDTVDPERREEVKEMRSYAKKQIKAIQDKYLLFDKDRIEAQTKICNATIKALLEVVKRFSQAFSEKKREKNILDFNDMEHMALQILIRPVEKAQNLEEESNSAAYERTETAKEYARHFKYVMIDEYQDSNLVQEFLLESISGDFDGNPNRFMVGDVKQSIYKFRLAKPEIFLEKYHAYSEETEGKIRIDLQQNFRSRKEVIDVVNAVFEKVMKKELGGIDYDERARLNLGASYPETGTDEMQPELLLFCKKRKDRDGQSEEEEEKKGDKSNPGEKITDIEIEAYGIANRIRRLMQNGRVTDEETGKLRPVKYKDIVILLRSMAHISDTMKNVLESQGIPVYVASKSGYFGTLEVKTLIHLLKIINNPLQDIPFYGVLHSFVTGMTEDQIALIRSLEREKADTLYEQCVAFAMEEIQEGDENHTVWEGAQKKVGAFLQNYQDFREVSKYRTIYELIQYVMNRLDYRLKISAMPMGDKRLANIDMILQKAADYEQSSFSGLYDFIRYLELLERYEVDYGEVNTLGEQADVVRIMTMHSSKGLEFPICFVSGLSKGINMRDIYGDFIVDADYGIGMKCIDVHRRTVSETLRKTVICELKRQSNLAEEMRVLYVALTRAKEKLIMTAAVDDAFRVEDMYDKKASLADLLCIDNLFKILSLAMDETTPVRIEFSDYERLQKEAAVQLVSRKLLQERLKECVLCKPDATQEDVVDVDEKLQEKIALLENSVYPYENLQHLHTKTSVSELKHAAMRETDEAAYELFAEKETVPYLPRFLKEEETVTGTVRGNAYHKFMELFDFTLLEEQEPDMEMIDREILRMRESGKLSEEYAGALWKEKLLHFCKSDVAGRMAKAAVSHKLYREQPFVLGLPASRLDAGFPSEETVLIQGIIDVFFEEDGNYILLDYKTDKVAAGQQLIDRYKTQMDYYEEAITALKGKVTQKNIYSFALGETLML